MGQSAQCTNGYLKTVFDERGIEIPFHSKLIWLGEEPRTGTTQPFKIEAPQPQACRQGPQKLGQDGVQAVKADEWCLDKRR